MKAVFENIQDYIAQFPADIQNRLQTIRTLGHTIIPNAQEAIKYNMPTLMVNNKNVFHFAAFKHHIGIYPLPHTIEVLQNEISGYVQGKGSIQFPNEKPLPIELIKTIITVRFQELSSKNQT
ncbi:iron chaperone [Gracilinema caldarium]|uniref:iron chaperone n=1 Tax=Gracilinema caldarium TaxID=215591 RepID=UPI0026ED221C|nr:DUF1801 domain-containing protein [Gracilinema caldarium]